MTIKQKIWSIPIVTILLFTIGMAITNRFSSHTYDLLQRTDNIHYPYQNHIQTLSNTLKGIQENLQNAIIINDRHAITLAQQKAQYFRETSAKISALDGKKPISQTLVAQFDHYFALAENAVNMLMNPNGEDAMPALERKVAALKVLEASLQQEQYIAMQSFGKSLDDSRSNVRRMLSINLVSIILVAIGLTYISYRLIKSMMGNMENLRVGAQQIAQGDLTARIPVHSHDELAQVILSFNAMGEGLQAATEKQLHHEKQLEALNQELEQRVVERTAELGVALEEANQANISIAYMADHDGLTGMLNRRRFQEEFERWGKYALRYERAGSLMFIDLDKFKAINDTYGHQAGDEYLLAVANTLKRVLRSNDFLGRWGGDEFVVLLPEANASLAREVAEKLIKTFHEVPVTVAGQSLHASMSIGIASLPEHTVDVSELMAFADAAMYKAKESGRGRCWLYSATEHEVQRVDEHVRWAGRIRRALETDQFILFYQPLLDLKTGETPEYEGLLRMEDTDGHFISPGLFLESAERFDLSIPLDHMVIRKAAYKIAMLSDQNIQIRLSLNLSHKSLDDVALFSYVGEVIEEFDIAPEKLSFEIAEETILQNMNRSLNLGAEISRLGCRLILDDIGVSFTSFQYLAPLSIRAVKIQGNLIRNLHQAENRDYIASLCKKSHENDIAVTAKFVEDATLLGLLRELGVDYAQGFAVGKPMESFGSFEATI